jgi:hypothetical protein
MEFNSILPTLYTAIQSEVTTSEKAALDFIKALQSGNVDDVSNVRKALEAKFSLLDKFYDSQMLDSKLLDRVGYSNGSVNKTANTGVAPNIAYLQGIDNWTDTLGIDTTWMQLYTQNTITTATEAWIMDWVNILRHKQYAIGAPIESQALSTETAARFGRKRYGGGSFADRSLLGTQARYTLSNMARAHQLAELRLRADAAYTALALAAASPAGTTAFSTSIIETVNAAYVSLITSLAQTDGYQINASAKCYLLCHLSQQAAVQAAFRTIQGFNGNNILLEFNVQPIYTANTNWSATIGSKNSGLLILPNWKNNWVNFQEPRLETEQDPKRDGVELTYQYYFNHNTEGGQCQVVNFA